MDTKYWGPAGHKLLHSIAYCYSFNDYQEDINKNKIISFFNSIYHILPCIYCRRSYKEYIKDIPLRSFLKKSSKNNMFKWIYLIHNKINDKLRKQGYLSQKNPKYETVLSKYNKYVKKIKNCSIIGWEFLYSIVFDYPQYSFELSKTRYNGYIIFFTNLQYLLPCKKVRNIYKNHLEKYPIEENMKTRNDFKKWLYKFEQKLRKNFCSFEKRCKQVLKYKINNCNNNSCRKD
jgi:hypothetical protein